MASRASRSSALLASLALAALAVAPLFGTACGSNAETPGDGGLEASTAEAGDAAEDASNFLVDAAAGARCTMQNFSDPVGLCVQKLAILGAHAEFSSLTGMPSAWSVDTLFPATDDAGSPLHDVRDDIAYGAALADYYASSTAYGDPDSLGIITGDMDAVAQLLQTELTTLPADYDGVPYLRLRRLAAGLRLASFPSDANAIDALAASYGRAIYTSYYHAVSAPTSSNADAGPDASAEDGGGIDASSDATDDAAIDATVDASSEDAGTEDAATVDAGTAPTVALGILGVPSDGGIAYESDKAASGALALIDMAARANGLTFPPSADGGLDATAPDPTDALAWSQAASAVLEYLASRAQDTTGLYFTQLQTSSDPGHDTVTDDGAFTSETQGAVALAYVRAARLVTLGGLKTPSASTLVTNATSILAATQATAPSLLSLWDTAYGALTLQVCTLPTLLSSCGSGYFAAFNETRTTLDARKSISANAFLLDALHRASVATTLPTTEVNDLTPLTALFTHLDPDQDDAGGIETFFTQVPGQAGFVAYVAQDFELTELEDGGPPNDDGSVYKGATPTPLARFYTTAATADAIDGMNDLWVGLPGAPSFFQ